MEEISLRFPETFAYALGDVRQMKELQQAVSKCQNHFGGYDFTEYSGDIGCLQTLDGN